MRRILAATDFSTRSQRAVRRAGLLARQFAADLVLVHIVDDDQPETLVALETREAERILAEQIDTLPELDGSKARSLVATGDAFDGILRAATDASADLVVMGAHRKQLLRDVFLGTTVERVIRAGARPVLMVNRPAEQAYRHALVAVDRSEASLRAIAVGRALGFIDGPQVTLVHAFVAPALGKLRMAGTAKDTEAEYLAGERTEACDELLAFLDAGGAREPGWPLRIEEGLPFEVISKAVSDMVPDLAVVGTAVRTGFARMLRSSVAEEVLGGLDIDVLAVPPCGERG
jgi:nucleotide-binding universal stress UspA family protein